MRAERSGVTQLPGALLRPLLNELREDAQCKTRTLLQFSHNLLKKVNHKHASSSQLEA
jgi:hypothetical protein